MKRAIIGEIFTLVFFSDKALFQTIKSDLDVTSQIVCYSVSYNQFYEAVLLFGVILSPTPLPLHSTADESIWAPLFMDLLRSTGLRAIEGSP